MCFTRKWQLLLSPENLSLYMLYELITSRSQTVLLMYCVIHYVRILRCVVILNILLFLPPAFRFHYLYFQTINVFKMSSLQTVLHYVIG